MRLYAALFAIGLVVYGTLAWDRIGKQSPAPHFVLQADAWLHGTSSIAGPLKGDDWAKVETVSLDDGSEVSGRRLRTRPMFRTMDATSGGLANPGVAHPGLDGGHRAIDFTQA